MMRSWRWYVLVAAAAFFVPSALAGQAWDSPLLRSTDPEPGLGVYIFDPAGADVGLLGTMRWSGGPFNSRLRLGVADGPGDGITVLGGIDGARLLRAAGGGFPLDVGLVGGIGAGVSDYVMISAPIGVLFGIPLEEGGIRVVPHAGARAVLDLVFADDVAGESTSNLDLDLAVDFGVDLAFSPGWRLRLGATAGREALAIGIAF